MMGCGCNKNRQAGSSSKGAQPFSVMGGYKYLSVAQISARLEVFKRMYCKDCGTRYDCTFETYNTCATRPQN
jgi:hypothetical protein